MTNFELIKQHDEDTKQCSVFGHMQKASTTYKDIIAKGEEIVTDLLEYLDAYDGGMNIIMLLYLVTGQAPYKPERIGDSKMGAYNVGEARIAWLSWGKENKYIL
jgi:hypothetical protein